MRRTPAAASLNSARGLTTLAVVAVVSAVLTIPAAAQPLAEPGATAAEPSPASTVPAEPTPAAVAYSVQIVVVGTRLPLRVVESALGSAFRSEFDIRLVRSVEFAPQDLFGGPSPSSAELTVWLDATSSDVVRMYFANREGTRYLVRTMPLSARLDELDREALGQVVEWSVIALSSGSEGMTREEAVALLEAPRPAPPAAVEPTPAPPPATWRGRRSGWLGTLGANYRLAAHSEEIPVVHGPVLRAGADWMRGQVLLGAAGSFQLQIPARHRAEGIELELRTSALRVELRALRTHVAPNVALGVAIGAGLDLVSLHPKATRQDTYEVAADRTTTIPLATSCVLAQWELSPAVRLDVALGLEADLGMVHYDLVSRAEQERFITRWPFRPLAAAGVEFF